MTDKKKFLLRLDAAALRRPGEVGGRRAAEHQRPDGIRPQGGGPEGRPPPRRTGGPQMKTVVRVALWALVALMTASCSSCSEPQARRSGVDFLSGCSNLEPMISRAREGRRAMRRAVQAAARRRGRRRWPSWRSSSAGRSGKRRTGSTSADASRLRRGLPDGRHPAQRHPQSPSPIRSCPAPGPRPADPDSRSRRRRPPGRPTCRSRSLSTTAGGRRRISSIRSKPYSFRYDENGVIRVYPGSHGREDAADLAPFVPTPPEVVARMLERRGGRGRRTSSTTSAAATAGWSSRRPSAPGPAASASSSMPPCSRSAGPAAEARGRRAPGPLHPAWTPPRSG
ncbi:MAG: hypothetical protein M0C28_07120 [Candidatus Moduliflexus flocculans]|nr:hypothetical protein [Candidatus Moduliflexus flocculans]